MIINANGTEISILKRSNEFEKNYISLTDIARRKNPHEPKDIVKKAFYQMQSLTKNKAIDRIKENLIENQS